jgi:hypothetical protein
MEGVKVGLKRKHNLKELYVRYSCRHFHVSSIIIHNTSICTFMVTVDKSRLTLELSV